VKRATALNNQLADSRSAFARYRGLESLFFADFLGLAPQALCCHPLRGLGARLYVALLEFKSYA
jgi:hypothetical protein